jgi:DNA-binding NarL/FixJ family response regulator
MIRILMADDHAIVRRGLKQILEAEPRLATVAEAENAMDVLKMVRESAWDLVILDINLPGRSGLDVLTELHNNFPNLPVLILSMYSEDQYALRVLRAGASGFLNKQSAPEELIKAIKRIHGGGKYISETLAEKLVTGMDGSLERPADEILSDREYQIMILIASGKSVGEIADSLSLSVKTVSTYRRRALEKLHLKNNSELTAFAVRSGLVS